MVNQDYALWLRRHGEPVFEQDGFFYRLYKRALLPATMAPCFLDLSPRAAGELLRDSGAWFLRYSSDPGAPDSDWWFVVCDRYDLAACSPGIRVSVRSARRKCSVARIEAGWLAENGYPCYQAAHRRYRHARPVGPELFRRQLLQTVDGPFAHWGVFVDSNLAGYCQCVIEGTNAATTETRLDPAYFSFRTSYALVDSLLEQYVRRQGMTVSNGNRAVLHQTGFQDLLLKLGFRRLCCRLRVEYRPWLGLAVRWGYPWRRLLNRLPETAGLHSLRSLLYQESLRRSCLSGRSDRDASGEGRSPGS